MMLPAAHPNQASSSLTKLPYTNAGLDHQKVSFRKRNLCPLQMKVGTLSIKYWK
jgi:hypothetical protein